MSERENFVLRWSRRKRGADPGNAQPAAKDAETGAPARPDEIRDESESSFDISSLPPVESITAETDIRAFLASGVPADLKRAALRRAWSADPAIRDFVGLSENSWDFNAPGAAGGFGSLDSMSDEVRRMVAQLFTPPPERSSANSPAEPMGAPKSVAIPAREQEKVARTIEESATRDDMSHADNNIGAMQERPDEDAKVPLTGRRHQGGALPK